MNYQLPYQCFAVKKENGQLLYRISPQGGFQTRIQSTIKLINTADSKNKFPDFDEIIIYTGDRWVKHPEHPKKRILCYSYVNPEDIIDAIPDFMFGGWPEIGLDDYNKAIFSIIEAGKQKAETCKLGWIGTIGINPIRQLLHDYGNINPESLDIIDIGGWQNKDGIKNKTLTPSEMVSKWKYLIDIEGDGYSGRLKLLLFSGRTVFIQEKRYNEWYYEHLRPFQHFIPVKNDLSDLLERLQWCKENPKLAEEIGQNGQRFAFQWLSINSAIETITDKIISAGIN